MGRVECRDGGSSDEGRFESIDGQLAVTDEKSKGDGSYLFHFSTTLVVQW